MLALELHLPCRRTLDVHLGTRAQLNRLLLTTQRPRSPHQVSITIIATGFGTVEPQLGALGSAQQAGAARPAPAAAGAAVQPAAAQRTAPQQAAAAAGEDAGGIEIPAFLRRRRALGK